MAVWSVLGAESREQDPTHARPVGNVVRACANLTQLASEHVQKAGSLLVTEAGERVGTKVQNLLGREVMARTLRTKQHSR
jgi:aspartate oxidase